jgi:hypothetical protein
MIEVNYIVLVCLHPLSRCAPNARHHPPPRASEGI